MSEKRKNPRINVSFPVECKTLPSRSYFYTVSKDLSLNGAKIISNSFIPKNNFLKLNINFIDRILNLKVKVIWCVRENSSERYCAGLEFVEMNEPCKNELQAFLTKVDNY